MKKYKEMEPGAENPTLMDGPLRKLIPPYFIILL